MASKGIQPRRDEKASRPDKEILGRRKESPAAEAWEIWIEERIARAGK